MIKQKRVLLWAILSFWVTACASLTGVTASSSVDHTDCDFIIKMNEVTSMLPGETVFLVLNKTGFDWQYSWSRTAGILSEPTSSSTSFTAPASEGIITVSVEVTDGNGCYATDTRQINVINIVTPGPPLTASPTASHTPKPTVSPTPQPSPSSSPTSEPTATPSITPQPTLPPKPTNTPMTAPVITRFEVLPGGAIRVEWYWDGELSPTQNFAVRFWSANDPRPEARYSITWTKELSYEFGINNAEFPIGTYYINVAVMEGSSEGVHYALAESDNLQIAIEPPPPTDPPPVLP